MPLRLAPPPAVEEKKFPARESVRDLYYFQKAEPTSAEVEGSQGQGGMVQYTRLTQAEREKLKQHYDALDQVDGAPKWNDIPVPHTEPATKTADEWKPAPLKMETPPAAEPDTKINNAILTDQANKHQQIEPLEESTEETALRRELETNRDAADQVLKRLLKREISTNQYDLTKDEQSPGETSQQPQSSRQTENSSVATQEKLEVPPIWMEQDPQSNTGPIVLPITPEEEQLECEALADKAIYSNRYSVPEGMNGQAYWQRQSERYSRLIAMAEQRNDGATAERYGKDMEFAQGESECPGGCHDLNLPEGSLGNCTPKEIAGMRAAAAQAGFSIPYEPRTNETQPEQTTEETRQEQARAHRERIFSHYGRQQEANRTPQLADREELEALPIWTEETQEDIQNNDEKQQHLETEFNRVKSELENHIYSGPKNEEAPEWGLHMHHHRELLARAGELAGRLGHPDAGDYFKKIKYWSGPCPGGCMMEGVAPGSHDHCNPTTDHDAAPIDQDENEPEDDTQTQPRHETYKAVYYDTGEYAIGSTKREALEKLHDMDDRGNGDFKVDDLENGDQGQGDTLPEATDDLLGAEANHSIPQEIGNMQTGECPGDCAMQLRPPGSHGHCSGNRINYGNTLGGGINL